MNPRGANSGEMKDLPGLDDDDIDRLIAGRGEADDELASFIQGVGAAYVSPPSSQAAIRHVAAAARAARQAGAARAPVPLPPVPPGRKSWAARWRRRTVFGASVATLTLSLAATIGATAATGGLAASGELPAPIQRAVAQAASNLGIDLPRADNPPAAAVTPGATAGAGHTSTPANARTTAPAATQPAHGPLAPSGAGAFVVPTATAGEKERHVGRAGEEGNPAAGSARDGHDNCLVYAAQIVSSIGIRDDQRWAFFWLLAQDPTAVTARVASGGTPDPACTAGIDRATAEVASATGGGDRKGPAPAPDDPSGHGRGGDR